MFKMNKQLVVTRTEDREEYGTVWTRNRTRVREKSLNCVDQLCRKRREYENINAVADSGTEHPERGKRTQDHLGACADNDHSKATTTTVEHLHLLGDSDVSEAVRLREPGT